MMNLRRQAVLGLVERRWMTALVTLSTGRHAQTPPRSRIHTLRIPMLICSYVQVIIKLLVGTSRGGYMTCVPINIGCC